MTTTDVRARREQKEAREADTREAHRAEQDRRRFNKAHRCEHCRTVHPNVRKGGIYGDGTCPTCRTLLWDALNDVLDGEASVEDGDVLDHLYRICQRDGLGRARQTWGALTPQAQAQAKGSALATMAHIGWCLDDDELDYQLSWAQHDALTDCAKVRLYYTLIGDRLPADHLAHVRAIWRIRHEHGIALPGVNPLVL